MGEGWQLGYVKFSYTKNPEKDFFIKNPHLTKKVLAVGRRGCGCVARISDFCLFQKNPSLKINCFLFEGVKVTEDWLV